MRIPVTGEASPISGTLVSPSDEGSKRPGWVVLHGITRPGRRHPELLRFTHALAATGRRVLVPEIRNWMDLQFAPERAQAIIRSAVDWLHVDRGTSSGGVVLVGFSFGAPQVLLAASDPEVSRKLRGVVGWGGYADLVRIFQFAFTGEHEWDGRHYQVRPDPYVRWIIGTNCLLLSPARRRHEAVVRALHALAAEAGDRRIEAGSPELDPMKQALRSTMPSEDVSMFDLFAPSTDRDPNREEALALVDELIPFIREALPLLDPVAGIQELPMPIRLLHGRSDHLIPYTETLRLGAALQPVSGDISTRITGLFQHTGGPAPDAGGLSSRVRENLGFLEALRGVFTLG